MLSIDKRCPMDREAIGPDAWKPGDLNQFFTNITTLADYQQFEPNVLSRPNYLEGDTKEDADYEIGPWVVVLDNVVSEEEAERMIELGAIEGYQRSSDVGKLKVSFWIKLNVFFKHSMFGILTIHPKKFDGSFESNVNDKRTSTNAWCQNECYTDPVAKRVIERVTNITNIPESYSESLQVR